MKFKQLRPVGEPIICQRSSQNAEDYFSPCKVNFYASGTAALAAAISAVLATYQNSRSEIILPAYACPSLVSAILFNGAKPVLVDLAPNQIGLNLPSLEKKLTERTAAVISVDLFGLPSITPQLREIVRASGAYLIHDCAQATPTPTRLSSIKDELVVLSFGRGKPVSILNGGAILRSPNNPCDLPASPAVLPPSKTANFQTSIKYRLYNLLVKPRVYWLTDYMPIKVGETRFKRLDKIGAISPVALQYLAINLHHAAIRKQRLRTHYAHLGDALAGQGWIDLCHTSDPLHLHSLLRYAMLAPSQAIRDDRLKKLNQLGLGATSLYQHTLPDITNMPNVFGPSTLYPNASSFSERLLTIPIHHHIDRGSIKITGNVLKMA